MLLSMKSKKKYVDFLLHEQMNVKLCLRCQFNLGFVYIIARSRAPVDRLEVLHTEPDSGSVQLAWQRVAIPPYGLDEEPLMYMVEYNEAPMPDWKPLVTGRIPQFNPRHHRLVQNT